MQLTVILCYLLVQVLIGIWVSRKIKNDSDYFVAGRSLGIGLASFSLFATWFGAETCMGSAAAIFEDGLSGGRADPFGYAICLVLAGLLLAKPLRKRKYVTLIDLFKDRYAGWVEKLAVIVFVPSSIIWAAAQVRAFGQVISYVSPISFETAALIASFFVIAYTFLGGLMGDVVTDFLQSIVLMIGLGLLLVFSIPYLGGLSEAIASIPAEKLSFRAADESFWARMDTWMIPILGSLLAQEVIARMLACKNVQTAQRATFLSAGIYIVVGLIPVFLALIGGGFNLTLEDPEHFLPQTAELLLPPVLYLVFMGALISAILSTVDSTILTVSSLISNNLIFHSVKNWSGKRKLWTARLISAAAGFIAYYLAISGGSIYDLVELASSFGAPGMLVCVLFGLYSNFGGPIAAGSTLVVGLVSTRIFEVVIESEAPFIASIAAAFVTYLVVGFVEMKVSNKSI